MAIERSESTRPSAEPEASWLACPSCGYLLIGLDRPLCPECGQQVEVTLKGGRKAHRWFWIFVVVGLLEFLGALADLAGGSLQAMVVASDVSRFLFYVGLGMAYMAGVAGLLRAGFARFPVVGLVGLVVCHGLQGLAHWAGLPTGAMDWRHSLWTLTTVVELACVAGVAMMLPTSVDQMYRFAWQRSDWLILVAAALPAILLLVFSGIKPIWLGRFDPHAWLHHHASGLIWPVVLLRIRRVVL